MDLKDRVALVAGGTGTLGIAIARALAQEGAHVAITYLERKDAAKETCAAVEALGRKAWSIALDQTDAAAIAPAIQAVVSRFGRLARSSFLVPARPAASSPTGGRLGWSCPGASSSSPRSWRSSS